MIHHLICRIAPGMPGIITIRTTRAAYYPEAAEDITYIRIVMIHIHKFQEANRVTRLCAASYASNAGSGSAYFSTPDVRGCRIPSYIGCGEA